MSAYAFASDQLAPPVTIQVSPCHAMGLGPRIVDEVLGPGGRSVGLRLALLPPVHAIIVATPPNQVVTPIPIDIG